MRLVDSIFRRRERIKQIRMGRVVRLDTRRPKPDRVISLRR